MVLSIFLEFAAYTTNIFLLIPLAGLSTAFHFPCRKFRLSHSCLCPCSRKTPFHLRAILCRMECSSFFAFSGLKTALEISMSPLLPTKKCQSEVIPISQQHISASVPEVTLVIIPSKRTPRSPWLCAGSTVPLQMRSVSWPAETCQAQCT